MAITRSVRPSVIVLGHAERISELKTRGDARVYAHEVVLAQENNARVGVRVYLRENEPVTLPRIGDFWPVECSVEESREYGTTLQYERDATAALDAAFPAAVAV